MLYLLLTGSAVVGVHASPCLEVGDCAFDHVTNLVDRSVEFFLPVEELSAGWLAIRSGDAGPDITFIADGVVIAEKFTEPGGLFMSCEEEKSDDGL